MKINDIFPPVSDDSNALASELAQEMLSFIAEKYRNASNDEERLQLTLEYAYVIAMLQRTVHKATHKQRYSFPGRYERKGDMAV